MPDEFDPMWEYWVGDDEVISYLRDNSQVDLNNMIVDLLENSESKKSGAGMRFGSGDPDSFLPCRFGKSKTPDPPPLKYAICPTCKFRFEEIRHGTRRRFCSSACSAGKTGGFKPGAVKSRRCPCGKEFVNKREREKFCSISCSNKQRGRLGTNDELSDKFREMWLRGDTRPQIELALGISEKTVKVWRDKLGLPKRK